MPEWLWSIVIGVVVIGLIAVIYHANQERFAKIEQWQKDKQIADHDFRHDEYNQAITRINSELWPLLKQVELLEKKHEAYGDWKHRVVDPYIPRAVDEHERRLNKLDAKVFNGNK